MRNQFNLGDEVTDEDDETYTVIGLELPDTGETPVYKLRNKHRGFRRAQEGMLALAPRVLTMRYGTYDVFADVDVTNQRVVRAYALTPYAPNVECVGTARQSLEDINRAKCLLSEGQYLQPAVLKVTWEDPR